MNELSDLNLRSQNMKLWEENIGKNLLDIDLGNDFLDITSETKATKSKINKWNYINLKSFCPGKESTNKVKRQPIDWEKYL